MYILKKYLLDQKNGIETDLAWTERFARLMGLSVRGKSMIVCCIQLKNVKASENLDGIAQEAAAALEIRDCCFTQMEALSCAGAITLPDTPGVLWLEKFCDRFRTCMKEHLPSGTLVTMGVSLPADRIEMIPGLFNQADLALFNQIYDGADKSYLYEKEQGKSRQGRFQEIEHLKELNRGIEERDSGLFQIALRHMFDDIIRQRLGRTCLRRVLVELMAILFSVGLDEDIPFILQDEKNNSVLNFEFVYHMESIEREYESFLDVFLKIIHYLNQKEKRLLTYSNKVRCVMDYIEAYYDTHLELGVLADQAELSTNYLCYLFKKETGFRIVEYINLVRMEHAKDFIRSGGFSAAQVGEKVGFTDPSYFCTMFKRYTGSTITEYRNRG